MISNFNKLIQSKIVWGLFIGLVVFAFVAMDMATPDNNSPKKNNVVGKVFNDEVKYNELMRSFYSTSLDYTLRSGQELRMTDQVEQELTNAAWERIAVLKEANNQEYSVSNDEIIERIKDIIRYVSQSDQYNPEIYDAFVNNFLPRYGMNAKDFDLFIKETSKPISDFPFPKLNSFTQGIFPTQLFTVASGSGAGKSTICRELAYHFLVKRNLKLGYIGLEESVQRTLQGLVGIDLNIPLHLAAEETVDQDELKKSFDRLTSTRNLFLYNHFGSLDPDTLLEQIRYLATVDGVQIIILDHITIVTSGLDLDNERRAIDVTMTKLRSLCESTGIALILVSHLRRPQGQAHEEGREISTSDLKGSSGLLQLSDVVLGASRNQVGEASERQRLQLKILKSRHTGMTGEVDKLLYDQDTGRLIVYENVFGD